MNTEYMLAVCEKHLIHLSFTKEYKITGGIKTRHPKCTKRNCYRDAEFWLLIDLKDVMPLFIERGQSQLVVDCQKAS